MADDVILLERALERELLDEEVVDAVPFDAGLTDGMGIVGTSVISSVVVMNISPVVVRTAYCLSLVIGWMVEDSICTRTPFASTISPGRRVD